MQFYNIPYRWPMTIETKISNSFENEKLFIYFCNTIYNYDGTSDDKK